MSRLFMRGQVESLARSCLACVHACTGAVWTWWPEVGCAERGGLMMRGCLCDGGFACELEAKGGVCCYSYRRIVRMTCVVQGVNYERGSDPEWSCADHFPLPRGRADGSRTRDERRGSYQSLLKWLPYWNASMQHLAAKKHCAAVRRMSASLAMWRSVREHSTPQNTSYGSIRSPVIPLMPSSD